MILKFEDFLNERTDYSNIYDKDIDTDSYWNKVAKELTKLFKKDKAAKKVSLDDFEKKEFSRNIQFNTDNSLQITISQDWDHDGSPGKPVTTIEVEGYGKDEDNWETDFFELGRFAIWDETPKDYAEDIYSTLKDQYLSKTESIQEAGEDEEDATIYLENPQEETEK